MSFRPDLQFWLHVIKKIMYLYFFIMKKAKFMLVLSLNRILFQIDMMHII